MSEAQMRRKVVDALRCFDAVSVENPAYPGTPDVNFVEGWLELKWLREWPKKPTTNVTIDHFTKQQRVWLKRRWRKGGNVYLVLQVRNEWFVFNGETAADKIGSRTKDELKAIADHYWITFSKERLINAVRTRPS